MRLASRPTRRPLATYSPGHVDEGLRNIEALRDETRVIRIDVAALSGKARRV